MLIEDHDLASCPTPHEFCWFYLVTQHFRWVLNLPSLGWCLLRMTIITYQCRKYVTGSCGYLTGKLQIHPSLAILHIHHNIAQNTAMCTWSSYCCPASACPVKFAWELAWRTLWWNVHLVIEVVQYLADLGACSCFVTTAIGRKLGHPGHVIIQYSYMAADGDFAAVVYVCLSWFY